MADDTYSDETIGFFHQFLRNDEDESGQDDTPRFGRKPARRELPNARDVLVALALNEAVSPAVRDHLLNGGAKAVVVAVPDSGWVAPVAHAISEFAEGAIDHRIARDKVPLPRDLDEPRLATWLQDGHAVVGVAQDPDRALPPLLLSVAEIRIVVPPPAATLVIEVIRHCQEGEVPADAAELRTQILSFDEICGIIVHTAKPADTVARLKNAIEKKLGGNGRKHRSLPRLEDAVEYGAAREWALSLQDDIADLRAGLIDWEDIDRGCVFFGPPGTGKTLLASMLGEACGIPTVVSSVADLFASSSGYLDGVIKAQRKVFDEAKAKSPCILFLDELNAMPNADTVGDRNKDYWLPVILDFYQLLDGAMNDRAGVIVIGATNRIEDIHPAILRPGRLERAIHVGRPDKIGVERIMRHHLGGDLTDADLGNLAMLDANMGATGAIIMEQIRAARRAARRDKRPIAIDDLASQIVMKDDRAPEERRRAAIHEAGHAVAGCVLGNGVLDSVSILRTEASGGSTRFEQEERRLVTRAGFDVQIMTLLAGRAAEEMILGEPSQGAGGGETSDLGLATHSVAMLEGSLGLGSSLMFRAPPEDATELLRDTVFRQRVDEALKDLYRRTLELMRLHEADLRALTDALLDKRLLSGQEVRALVGNTESMTPNSSTETGATGLSASMECRNRPTGTP